MAESFLTAFYTLLHQVFTLHNIIHQVFANSINRFRRFDRKPSLVTLNNFAQKVVTFSGSEKTCIFVNYYSALLMCSRPSRPILSESRIY